MLLCSASARQAEDFAYLVYLISIEQLEIYIVDTGERFVCLHIIHILKQRNV